MIKNILKIIFITLVISSCSEESKLKFRERFASSASDYKIKIRPVDPNSSQDFKDGWRDGCEVGISAGANTYYKSFYKNNKADGYRMMNSPDYEMAWTNSFWLCYRSKFTHHKSNVWTSYFSGYR